MTRTLWRLQQIFAPHWISMISSDQTIDWILLERPLKCYKADQIVHHLGQIAHQMIRPPIIWSSCTWNRMESPVKKVTGCLPPSSDSLQPFPEYSKMLENSQNGEKGPISMVFLLFPSNGLNRTSLPKFTFLILTKNPLGVLEQIRELSLHQDFWNFRCNCHRLPLFVYIHNM